MDKLILNGIIFTILIFFVMLLMAFIMTNCDARSLNRQLEPCIPRPFIQVLEEPLSYLIFPILLGFGISYVKNRMVNQ